jgi:hypothetical protein
MSLRRLRCLACAALLLLLPACVLPSGWDARSNGGRYDPGPDDPYHSGQWGVTDMRSGSQNSFTFWLGGAP